MIKHGEIYHLRHFMTYQLLLETQLIGDTIDFAHTLYMGKDTKTLHLNQTKLFQLSSLYKQDQWTRAHSLTRVKTLD